MKRVYLIETINKAFIDSLGPKPPTPYEKLHAWHVRNIGIPFTEHLQKEYISLIQEVWALENHKLNWQPR